jgi:nucleotide-binding universal stress UspA family protein
VSDPVILLPLDGSERALAALLVAKALSELDGAPVRIIHVCAHAPSPTELLERLGLSPAALGGCSVEAREGEPAAVIVGAAEETKARLIVMCTHTATARPRGILGGTALAVLREASCPVVLVDPEHALHGWRLGRVLIPHDGTPAVGGAVHPAAALARCGGAELLVLQVAAGGVPIPEERGSLTAPLYLDQPQHEWPAWSSEFIGRLACVCPLAGLRARLRLGRGDPAAEILRVAREESADLIVLAWKGDWAPERAATLKAVVREAPCPTMAVRI